ncbi:hypothetical protein J3A83DRAFT_4190064 [Scleroderma citrinum]
MELQTTVPWAMYPQGVDILVFRMFDGEMKDRVVLATKTSGRMIFSLHRMVDSICIRTYNTNPKKTYPKQVTLAEGGTVVIGRSDDGFIYVFNKATSELVQMLQHSFIGQVQTVTTHDAGDAHLIIAVTSSNENNITISMWKKQAMTHLVAMVVIVIFAWQMMVVYEEQKMVMLDEVGRAVKV